MSILPSRKQAASPLYQKHPGFNKALGRNKIPEKPRQKADMKKNNKNF